MILGQILSLHSCDLNLNKNYMTTHEDQDPELSELLSRFPEDLIYEILLLLPVKPVSRFKCVCKSWLSLISSPDFVEAHLLNSTNDPYFTRHHMVLSLGRHYMKYDNVISLSVHSLLHNPVTEAIDHGYSLRCFDYVVGYCRGLVCLLNNNGDDVLLWNPCTRKSRTLPKVIEIAEQKDKKHTAYGFCYDESTSDYKVFAIFAHCPLEYKLLVYSLKSGFWRVIGDFPFMLVPCWGEFLNGAVHWFGRRPDLQFIDQESCKIVALDIRTEKYQEILLPVYVKGENDETLGTYQGKLSLFGYLEGNCVGFWVMNEYGVEESWTKLFTLELKLKPYHNPLLKQIAVTADGDVIMKLGPYIQLYNLREKTVRVLWKSIDYISEVFTFVESLVSPEFEAETGEEEVASGSS